MSCLRVVLLVVVSNVMKVHVYSQAVDQTIHPGAYGAGVVETVCARIETSCVFTEDKLMMRRLAYVESLDGTRPSTFRTGYFGGIWQVSSTICIGLV